MKENEISVVQYYLEVLEQGVDTKELAEKYAALNTKYKRLKVTTNKKIERIEEELKVSVKAHQEAMK